MDKPVFDSALEKAIEIKLKAVEAFEKEFINPIVDELNNPEKILGKPYGEWTKDDYQLAFYIYEPMPDILDKWIAEKDYESVMAVYEPENITV